MPTTPILILPGLDGRGSMLGEFERLCSSGQQTTVKVLPAVSSLDYFGLAEHFSSTVRQLPECHIVAESFSGPIGILVAAKNPDVVKQLTLVASFATNPVPRVASFLPWSLLFRIPMPSMVAKYFFIGDRSHLIPALRKAIGSNPTRVLRHRFKLVEKVNVLQELSELKCSVSYIRPTNDRIVPQSCLDRMLDANPDMMVRKIDGPHLILETQPEKSWQHIVLQDQRFEK